LIGYVTELLVWFLQGSIIVYIPYCVYLEESRLKSFEISQRVLAGISLFVIAIGHGHLGTSVISASSELGNVVGFSTAVLAGLFTWWSMRVRKKAS